VRRWNGWGEATVEVPLPLRARAFLEDRLGPGTPPRDCSLEEALARIPPSRLPDHPQVHTDPELRLRHAVGQGLPDWIAARSGRIQAPDGVAFPETNEDVRALLAYARAVGARVIPYGGGTSVVGHLRVLPDPRPALAIDLGRMNRLLALDRLSGLATFQTGIRGPDLEAALRAHGFTLGHYPQSFEYSTLGGWIATRSVGQFALGYGRIKELFVGGQVETAQRPLILPPLPPSAASPDLRHMVLGSEGQLEILREAVLQARPLPEAKAFGTFLFPDFDHRLAVARAMVQAEILLTMVRLSSPKETRMILLLSGCEGWVCLLQRIFEERSLNSALMHCAQVCPQFIGRGSETRTRGGRSRTSRGPEVDLHSTRSRSKWTTSRNAAAQGDGRGASRDRAALSIGKGAFAVCVERTQGASSETEEPRRGAVAGGPGNQPTGLRAAPLRQVGDLAGILRTAENNRSEGHPRETDPLHRWAMRAGVSLLDLGRGLQGIG